MKELWKLWSESGLRLPFVYDPITQQPSVSLLFAYITFVMSIVSLILLHIFPKLFVATTVTMTFWVMSVIFYMLRKLHKAKVDLDDKSIELDSGEENEVKD